MCRAWSHHSYRQLERLLALLRAERPELAWHLTRTYFAPHWRMRVCPRCDVRLDMWNSVHVHSHGRKNVALVPRVLRVVPLEVDPKRVEETVAWLDEHWRGGVFLPDELPPLVAVA